MSFLFYQKRNQKPIDILAEAFYDELRDKGG